jgi:hypothetical protein
MTSEWSKLILATSINLHAAFNGLENQESIDYGARTLSNIMKKILRSTLEIL